MKRVSALIVTYNNKIGLTQLLQDLFRQTRPAEEIIVVDNAGTDGTEKLLKEKFPNIQYLRLPENTGSAGGYYEGIKLAAGNCDFIWTLDDDVRLNNNSLEELLKGLENLASREKICAVRSVGNQHPYTIPTKLLIAPWRGTLIKTELVKEIGFPLKEFFIYGEDLEYSLRFGKNGYVCYWIPTSLCIEKRTEGKLHITMFGKTKRIYKTGFQLYYAFRNEFYIYRQYKNPGKLAETIFYALKVIFHTFIFEGLTGFGKIKAIFEGLFDGFSGRLGKNKKYLPDS